MAGYVNAVPAFVCFEIPAREASSFCDFWKLTSCNFIATISSMIEVNLFFFFFMCLLRINSPNLYPNMIHVDDLDFSGWHSNKRSDKFLLMLSVFSRLLVNFWSATRKNKTVFTRRQSAYFVSWFEMCILNHDSKYSILTACTPNHVEIRDLRWASQITVQRCFRVTHLKSRSSTWFGVHTVQNTVFRIVIQDAHLESRFKIRTLPSCENSLKELKVCCFTALEGLDIQTLPQNFKGSHLW